MISFPAVSPTRLPGRKMSRRDLLRGAGLTAVGLAGAGVLGGCGRDAGAGAGTRRITVLSSFSTTGRDAYWWVAKAKGFYAEAGLDVEVVPGSGTSSNITAMAGGAAQFAAFDAVGGIVSHGTSQDEGGAGIRLLALAQQQTLAAFFTLDPDIQDPLDFAGRSIAVVPGGGTALLLPTWLTQEGVDPDSVEVVNMPPPELVGMLAQGQVDIIDQYVVGVPLVEAATDGQTPTVFPIGDTLPDALGVGIWAAADIAENDPELCVRVREATLKGLAYSLEHPEEAGQILHDAAPAADPEAAAEELRLMQPYTLTPAGVPLGAVSYPQMARAIALMEAVGAIPGGTTVDQLTDPAITLGLDGDL